MRPALKAGLLPVWRDRETLQIGIDPRRAFMLVGLGRAAAVVGLLDGTREWSEVVEAAEHHGIPGTVTNRVLALLAAAGALDDRPADLLRGLPAEWRDRLAAELATAALAYGDGDGGARTLARRRAASVHLLGAGRIGSWISRLLAAAGVGRVTVDTLVDQPAGDGASGPDLVVLVDQQDAQTPSDLVRDRRPHLAVRAGEAIGVVGPLVDPGRSACLHCLELTRAERDPAWPSITAQATRDRHRSQVCDTALAAMVAAMAAAQALTFIDRGAAPAVRDGTLELVVPDWRWRRRTWPPHRRCPCAAADRAGGLAAAGSHVLAGARHDGEWSL